MGVNVAAPRAVLAFAMATCLAVVCLGAPGSAHAAAGAYAPVNLPGPPLTVPASQLRASLQCESSVTNARTEPVLLSPGTGLTPQLNYTDSLEPILSAHGIPWCTYTAPDDTLGDIQTSGEYIVNSIRTMYALAHQPIAIIGHSQGGMSMRWALRFWPDTRAMVNKVIGLAGTNQGTTDITTLPTTCDLGCAAADWQQAWQSSFIQALNGGAETFAGISYTNIYSHTDEVAVPDHGNRPDNCTSCLFSGAGQITNVAVQQICPDDAFEHLLIPVDPAADALVLDALTHSGPADPSRIPSSVCSELSGTDTNLLGYLTDIGEAGPGLGGVAVGVISPETSGAPLLSSPPPDACYVTVSCSGAAAPSLIIQKLAKSSRISLKGRAFVDVRVVVDEDGVLEPVPGATVSVGRFHGTTGAKGNAGIHLTSVKVGSYTLTASRPGTNAASSRVSVVR